MSRFKIIMLLLMVLFMGNIHAIPNFIDTNNHFKEMRKGISSRYSFINPLLDCYELDRSNLKDMRRMQRMIENQIATAISANKATSISVYYRDLKNGHWIGYKENEKYSPASLLKLPALIAALKQAEDDPNFLKLNLYAESADNNYTQNVDGKVFRLEIGKAYTIEQLLEYMIVYSDNQSAANDISKHSKRYIEQCI
ncbi:MAG: serine hydrolase [Bacteroidetes bacterium]|nr:serine hydrolase [Bacteroidota bacterium]